MTVISFSSLRLTFFHCLSLHSAPPLSIATLYLSIHSVRFVCVCMYFSSVFSSFFLPSVRLECYPNYCFTMQIKWLSIYRGDNVQKSSGKSTHEQTKREKRREQKERGRENKKCVVTQCLCENVHSARKTQNSNCKLKMSTKQ